MSSSLTDHELLQAYARDGSQESFAQVVRRYVDLVYSAARRQVASSHAAEEIAQSVFVDLARHARTIGATQPLAAWLYVVTRRTAVDYVRRESRRVQRERTAGPILAMNESSPDWSRLAPVLDEAMAELNDADRSAVVLRFFQNRSFREVGEAIGMSEDTAQKRVTRALDRLRASFEARGIAVTAATLATEVAANAVQTAPAGLATGIALGVPAMGTIGTGVAAAAKGAMGIWARQVGFGLVAAGLVGGAAIEWRSLERERESLRAHDAQQAALEERLAGADRERDAATRRMREIEARLAQHQVEAPANELDAEVAAWFQRVTRLKQLAAEARDLAIPELQFVTEREWFDLARDAKFDTDEERREQLKELRTAAKNHLAERLQRALIAYLDAHDGELPAAVSELAGFLEPPVNPAILGRYEMRAQGKVFSHPRDEWLLAERAVADPEHDRQLGIKRNTYELVEATEVPNGDMRRAIAAFATAHDGALPGGPAELVPYFARPLSAVTLKAFMAKPAADFSRAALTKIMAPN